MSDRLFDPGPKTRTEVRIKSLTEPVWSENKALLIARYLRLFVFITRHGTYIDPFAGPQTDRSELAWTARMVLDSEPKWFRNFYLFDIDRQQEKQLQCLASEHSDRDVQVYLGDSNLMLPEVLPVGSIREREATFCLLDQRTFECEWQLCEYVSRLRPGSMKVEQFYFLANYWMSRALSGIKTDDGERGVKAWLGRDDWREFQAMHPLSRRDLFVDKFRELGYRSVKSWPIYGNIKGHITVMFHMIHSTDHPEAPKLMRRAYSQAVAPPSLIDRQLDLMLD